nr:MAG TPA: hypothetical protein [Caudoviricetes sp.]
MNENVKPVNGEVSGEQIKRDPSLDLNILMQNAQVPKEAEPKKKTPLEEMMERGSNKGMTVTRTELEEGRADKPLRSSNESEETEKGIKSELAELDSMIEKAKSEGITGATDYKQHIAMIDHLTGHDHREEIRETIKLRKRDAAKAAGEDPNAVTVTDEEVETEYQQWLKTPEAMQAAQYNDSMPARALNQIPVNTEVAGAAMSDPNKNATEETDDKSDDDDNVEEEVDPEKEKLIQILIDKTGLGVNVDFTPEEQEKIIKSSKILVTEVEDVNLETLNVVDADKPFLELAAEETYDGIQTPVMFPYSMFRADIRGLSFGDLSAIAVNPDKMTVEAMSLRMSVLYNNLVNSSIGKFASYDEFANKFFMNDLNMGLFGVVCSTLPEKDSITMTCGHCHKDYDHTYTPRALLDLQGTSKTILSRFDQLIEASDVFSARKLFEDNNLKKMKRIRLPFSNVIIECGFATCAEYLGGKVAQILFDPDALIDKMGAKAEIYYTLAVLMHLVRGALVSRNGRWTRFTDVDDVLEIMYHLKPQDVAILIQFLSKFSEPYNYGFVMTDLRCPHCGHVTKRIAIEIPQLLFTRATGLRELDVELKETRG